ncbi:hypothetical protein [Rhodococcus sp. MALMAid1271]|mgnify:CR=1 FL=1|uniref:hypothetical protein n=1 Tax=Rhodococcus sp. MALMAid1271 TaxID=3411744 RepID=UPI003BA009D0
MDRKKVEYVKAVVLVVVAAIFAWGFGSTQTAYFGIFAVLCGVLAVFVLWRAPKLAAHE